MKRQKLNKFHKISALIALLSFSGFPRSAFAVENPLDLVGSYYGRIDFVTSGASFTDTKGLMNGANCLLDEAALTIPEFAANESPRLVTAYLYWSGTLISDDGDDLFSTADLSCKNENRQDIDCDPTNEDHLAVILDRAKQSVDNTVDLILPGQTTVNEITADTISMHGYYKSDGRERGTVAFFMASANITDLLKKELTSFAGTYTMRGLTADICLGQEALCSQNQTCSDLSYIHTNANASFSLVMVLEDPTWRLRRVALYQGLRGLNHSKSTIHLENISVSDPPNGKLSYYVLEGDSNLESTTDEWVSVNGGGGDLLLTDSFNPLGNPYNGTINSNSLTGIAGVDIDQFDISESLVSGAKAVDITFSTGSDRVVLGAVNVSVAVFSPVLEYDSSLAPLDEITSSPALKTVSYLATLSNTGNLDGTADFTLVLPAGIKSWQLEQIPTGSVDSSLQTGGNGNGIILVKGIKVEAGKVAQVRFNMTPTCEARKEPLSLNAEVTYDVGTFKLTSNALTITDDLEGSCPPLDKNPTPDIPTQPLFWQKYGLSLEGGGGCNGLGGGSWLPLLLLIPGLILRRHEKT